RELLRPRSQEHTGFEGQTRGPTRAFAGATGRMRREAESSSPVVEHPKGARMSNHFSAAMLKFPGDDARLDLTDLFLFASPQTAGKTVLILDVNPFMTGADFHPNGVYRINIDNDEDTQADAAFTFVFTESNGGAQTGTVYYATGSQAREPEPVGEVLIEGIPVNFDGMAMPV